MSRKHYLCTRFETNYLYDQFLAPSIPKLCSEQSLQRFFIRILDVVNAKLMLLQVSRDLSQRKD